MKRTAVILLLVVLAPILAPRLSGIGYEEPARGAQAWTYVRQDPLRVPDLMSELTEEDFEQGGDGLKWAAGVLTAESLGPDSVSGLLTALRHASTGFEVLEAYYPTAIQAAKTHQEGDEKRVQELEEQMADYDRLLADYDTARSELARMMSPHEVPPVNSVTKLAVRREELLSRIATCDEEYVQKVASIVETPNQRGRSGTSPSSFGPLAISVGPGDELAALEFNLWRAEYELSQIDAYNAKQLAASQSSARARQQKRDEAWTTVSEAHQALLAAAQAAHEQAENDRRYVADAEAHLPAISERREVCEDFYEGVCNRVRLMAWKDPMAEEHPELRAKAVHPRYVVGNACVFAKHAQEPWLRRCAIEQLAYWRGFYPEARATLKSIRDDKSDALAAFAGEQLESS